MTLSLLPGWFLRHCRTVNPALVLAVFVILACCHLPVNASAAKVTIKVTGLQGKMLENVEATLALPPGVVSNDGGVESHWLERHVTRIPGLVDQALRPFGYYRSSAHCELTSKNGSFEVLVEVDPGPAVTVSSVQVEVHGAGANEKKLKDLIKNFPLKVSEILDQEAYEEARDQLRTTALNLGYLDADFSRHVLTIDAERRSGTVDLLLETGPRYRFGAVSLSGAPDYPAASLQRYISFRAGEVFSFAKLGETQLNYLNTDAFREVFITPRKDLAVDQAVPIAIKLTSSPRHSLRPGIGYSTDSGARVSLRYLNRNVRNRGHKFNSDLSLAETTQMLSAIYTIPDITHLDSELLLKVGIEQDTPDPYETRIVYTEVERLKGFSHGRVGSVYLRLQQEDSDISDEHESARLVLPGLRWREVPYKDILRPEKGYAYHLELRGTDQILGSDTSLLQLLWGGTALLPLPGPLSLLSRLNGGTTWQNDPFGEVPASLRFFAGGDSSVRGYKYKSLGPVDANGEVVGGRDFLTLGTDLEYAIGKQWAAALFYDIGNAFDSWFDFNLMQGGGVGVRRYTVVGPVKIDLARQINVQDPSWRIHVSIGFSW